MVTHHRSTDVINQKFTGLTFSVVLKQASQFMKQLLPWFLMLVLIVEANGQYSKYVIRLKDKGSNTFSLNTPSQYLSARAIQRRTRYNIGIDSVDLPITQRYLDSIRKAGAVTILSTSKWLNQVLIQTTDAAALAKINSFPFVLASQPIGLRVVSPRDKFNEPVQPLAMSSLRTTADALSYGQSYDQVHIHEGEYLHNKGFRGETMQIAVLDAGFSSYKTITAFDSIRMNGQVLGERDFVTFDNSVNEDDSHGMYCLSILSANWPGKMVGTAPKAKYWLIRTENVFSEYPVEEHNWVVGAEFADSTGSDMISSSLGYADFDDPAFDHTYNDFYKNATTVTKGASIAVKKGMIVMNSAGNEGGNSWKYISFPADADSVCAVGAVNSLGQVAPFSSFGFPGKIKPNIASVGWGTVIAGLNNQPATGNGTSFSNPNVAGLVACLWQAFPQFNNMKILDAVYRSADKYTAPDNRVGFGIPNFRLAYEMLETEANATNISFQNDWLIPAPNPFRNNLSVYIKTPETGKISLRLVDALGRTMDVVSFDGVANQVRTITFNNSKQLAAGVYFLQYVSNTQKRIKKLLKQ
jgi:serine protease AprX